MSSTLTDRSPPAPLAPEAPASGPAVEPLPLRTRFPARSWALSLGSALFLGCTALFFGAVFLLLIATNMSKALDHDEHMYVSAGVLLARGGLLPYRDFPYLQMPDLAFVYGALFKLPGDPLLLARLFSTVCATLGMAVIFSLVSAAVGGGYTARFLFGGGSVLLLIANPLFAYTSGEAWNHDLPMLLSLLSVAALLAAMRHTRWGGLLFLSGLLSGLALGTRLSFAPVLPVLLASIFLLPAASRHRRMASALVFCAGVFVASIPVMLLFALAPSQFVFGNVQYHAANALYWQAGGYTRAMDGEGKLDYLWAVLLQPASLAAGLAALSLGTCALFYRKGASQLAWRGMLLSFAVVPCLLLGTLAPTPSWYQYFYAPLPFLVLGIGFAAAVLYRSARWAALPFAVAVAAACLFGRLPSPNLDTSTWVPIQAHESGRQIAEYAGSGPVLTLAPIYPLEGGAGIYPLFAAGPFILRSDSFFSPGERQASGVPSAASFLQQMDKQPPPAILTGYEPGLEGAWVDYATLRKYRQISLGGGKTLWLRAP